MIGLVRMSLYICSGVNYVVDNYIYCIHNQNFFIENW